SDGQPGHGAVRHQPATPATETAAARTPGARAAAGRHLPGAGRGRLPAAEMSIDITPLSIRPPWWYWAATVIALLWTLLGVVAWTMDLMMDPAALAEMSEAQQALYAARPQWVFVLYAVAVFSAFAG